MIIGFTSRPLCLQGLEPCRLAPSLATRSLNFTAAEFSAVVSVLIWNGFAFPTNLNQTLSLKSGTFLF